MRFLTAPALAGAVLELPDVVSAKRLAAIRAPALVATVAQQGLARLMAARLAVVRARGAQPQPKRGLGCRGRWCGGRRLLALAHPRFCGRGHDLLALGALAFLLQPSHLGDVLLVFPRRLCPVNPAHCGVGRLLEGRAKGGELGQEGAVAQLRGVGMPCPHARDERGDVGAQQQVGLQMAAWWWWLWS